MPSLKEIKGRINSVRSTLKITSAMKMVASAKLHHAQGAIANMLPYERKLHDVLVHLMAGRDAAGAAAAGSAGAAVAGSVGTAPASTASAGSLGTGSLGTASAGTASAGSAGAAPDLSALMEQREVHRVAIIAFASNSSLCGAFNSNAVRAVKAVISEYRSAGLAPSDITVYSIGRKMADAMRRLGYPSPEDYFMLSDKPSYAPAADLAQKVMDLYLDGTYDRVELVYNHFASTSSQPSVRETYLPLSLPDGEGECDYIVEPSREELLGRLMPLSTRLKVYTVLLDTSAAEHAARTVAMQIATDNGNELLSDLTLEYNKGRQQKITSEILDIVGGSLQ